MAKQPHRSKKVTPDQSIPRIYVVKVRLSEAEVKLLRVAAALTNTNAANYAKNVVIEQATATIRREKLPGADG